MYIPQYCLFFGTFYVRTHILLKRILGTPTYIGCLKILKTKNFSTNYTQIEQCGSTIYLLAPLNTIKVCNKLSGRLRRDIHDTWDHFISDLTRNENTFKTAFFELVETLIGDDAQDEQIHYLHSTRDSSR